MKQIIIARFQPWFASIPTPNDGTFRVLAVGTQQAMQALADRLNASLTSPNGDPPLGLSIFGGSTPEPTQVAFVVVECIDNVVVDDVVQIASGLLQKFVEPQIREPMTATTKATSTVAAPAPKRRLGKSAK